MFSQVYKYLRLSRPYYVIPAISTSIAGYLSSSYNHASYTEAIIVGLVFLFFGLASWSSNEITDRHSDNNGESKTKWGLYVSGGTNIFSSGGISINSVIIYIVSIILAGLFLATLLNTVFLILSTLFLTIGLAYSIKPIRLKIRGIYGLATVSIAYGIVAFTAGWVSGGQLPNVECLFFASMISITFFGFEGVAHLLDHEQDLRNNENTISVSLGQDRTRKILAICQFLPGVVLLLLRMLVWKAFPHLNIVLIIPLFFILLFIAIMTIKYEQISFTSALRILSVPLISAFSFILV